MTKVANQSSVNLSQLATNMHNVTEKIENVVA